MSDIKDFASQHHVPIIMDEGLEFLLQVIRENNCRE